MSASKIKLPFGLNEKGVLIHIDDAENGKKCNLVCSSCKSSLVAVNKGRQKQHHFRHDVVIECEGGLESAIHLAAKQMIMEKKRIKLSEYIVSESETDSKGKKHTEEFAIVVRDGKNMLFDDVQEEKELYGMKADIIAEKGSIQLIIEIFYRHKVDDLKIEKIKKGNMSAIEIDLSDLSAEDVKDMETFWLCVNDPRRVRWLHNVKDNESIHFELKTKLAEKIQQQEKKYQQEEIIKQKRVQKEKDQLVQALEELKIFRSNEHIERLNQEAETHPAWSNHSKYLERSLDELPAYLNLDVPNGD